MFESILSGRGPGLSSPHHANQIQPQGYQASTLIILLAVAIILNIAVISFFFFSNPTIQAHETFVVTSIQSRGFGLLFQTRNLILFIIVQTRISAEVLQFTGKHIRVVDEDSEDTTR